MIRWTRFEVTGNDDRKRICDWLTANRFDPVRVPLDAYVAHDDTVDEFVVEYFVEPRRIDPDTGDIPCKRVRRRALTPMQFA